MKSNHIKTTLDEQRHRKALVQKWRDQVRASKEAALPITRSELGALFDWLSEHNSADSCDNTLRDTKQFIREHDLPQESTIAWLMENGGGCDCEVLANIEADWRKDDGSIEYIGL